MKRNQCLLLLLLGCLFMHTAPAQIAGTGPFRISSPQKPEEPGYGSIRLNAGAHRLRIHTVLAYGENVKGLTFQVNQGFPFKLAPSQTGSTLNYVGTSLNLVLAPGDQAILSFIQSGSQPAAIRQLFVTGEALD